MSTEVVKRCDRHPDRLGQSVTLELPEGKGTVDLCDECIAPLRELLELARPVFVALPGGGRRTAEDIMLGRIRVDGV